MKFFKASAPKAAMLLLIATLVCGIFYTVIVTGIAQIVFPRQANGSIIEVDGKKYGSALLAQQYTDDAHMWGRIMHLDVSTFKTKEGKRLMYASPSNLSPASKEFETLVAQRVKKIRKANPDMENTAIPVDLVTASGSGLDPHISMAAAEYQIKRLADKNQMSEMQIKAIIAACREGKFLGLFGEETVNVLKVNLMLDGIL